MSERTYLTEFPDFELDVAIPEGWEDASWHDDVCPSWERGAFRLWVDYRDPARRELGNRRFVLCRTTDEGDMLDTVHETDDWDEMLEVIEREVPR